jgi:hypothetical protein
MNVKELTTIATTNAQSHDPNFVLIEVMADWILFNYCHYNGDYNPSRFALCWDIVQITATLLTGFGNNYTGRIRYFCNSGENCNCQIPCG